MLHDFYFIVFFSWLGLSLVLRALIMNLFMVCSGYSELSRWSLSFSRSGHMFFDYCVFHDSFCFCEYYIGFDGH